MSIPVWNGVHIGPTGQKLKQIVDSYPGDQSRFYITSAYRAGDPGHHGGLFYNGSPTAAIDVGFSYPNNTAQSFALARWLYDFSEDIVELIHSNSRGGSFVKNQVKVGPYAAADHWNHIHFATSSALADRLLGKIGSGGGGSGGSGGGSGGSDSQSEIAVTPYDQRPGLNVGSSGGAVAHLQWLLRDRLGYTIDHYDHAPFGPQTAAAVEDFKRNYPTPSGALFQNINSGVGATTWAAIEIAAARSISWAGRPEIRNGSDGIWVGYAQHVLREHANQNIDKVKGFPFGPQTETAVRNFRQELRDLGYDFEVYDLINAGVWEALDSWQQNEPWPPKEEESEPPPPDRPTIQQGDSGSDVCYAQSLLRSFGYHIDQFDHCPFGPQTRGAVEDFQSRNGLTVNGVVGPETWVKLEDPNSNGPGSGGGSSPSYNNTVKPIFGWDASDFDHDRGMRAHHITNAANEGIVFFTHKVTEKAGSGQWIHTRSGEKLAAARDAGIPFLGAYIVPRTGISVSAQVDFALQQSDQRFGWWKDFPGWFWQVDLEKWSYDAVPVSVGVEMCNQLVSRTNKPVVLYAPRWAYGNTIPEPWSRKIWNSHYVSGSGNFKNLYPGSSYAGWNDMSGHRPVILQYSASATIGGQSTCDANAFEGTALEFAQMLGIA